MKTTIRKIIGETSFIAPELLSNENFMQDWSRKYFGVSYDQEFDTEEDEEEEGSGE